MAYVQHSTIIPGAALQFVGDLKFHQSEPLIHKGADRRFKVSVCRNVCVVSYKTYRTYVTDRATNNEYLEKPENNYEC